MSIAATDPLVAALDVEDVTAYLGLAGWRRRADFPRPELIVFDGPDDDSGEPIQAVFPSSAGLSDFRSKLADLLDALAVLEGRPPAEIVLDMLNPSVDRVRARVISELASGGSIPLSFATTLVSSLRDLVVAAACAEERPKPFYARATKLAGQHADLWRLGQSRMGSFVATLECPVAAPPVAESAPPFERRVTERIIRGIGQLHTAVLDGSVGALFEGYTTGLNANMCEALLALRGTSGDVRLEIGVSWSKRLPGPADLPESVLIEARGFDFLHQAARVLRAANESTERELRGYIVKLSAHDTMGDPRGAPGEEEGSGSRVATLQFVEHGRRQHARMGLEAEDYRMACEAHRDRSEVTVRGRLERTGKQWRISGVREFRTVARG